MTTIPLGGDNRHFSASQWRSWLDCPARTYAEQHGQYKRKVTDAMLIGSWVDVCLLTPGDESAWMCAHDSELIEAGLLSKKDGKPLAKAQIAMSMVDECRKDERFMRELTHNAESQVELTGKLYGYSWVGHVDSLAVDKLTVTDLKTTASLTKMAWVECEDALTRNLADVPTRKLTRGNFIEQNNNWIQVAVIYRDLVSYNFDTDPTCKIAAVSRETPCNRGVYTLNNPDRAAWERERIRKYIDTIAAWRDGLEPAPMCGDCEYCRSVKSADVVDYSGPDVFSWF